MASQKKFILYLVAAVLVMSAAAYAMYQAQCCILTAGVLKVILIIIPCFALLTFLLYKNILRSNAKSPKRFVAAFIGSVSVKLLACALFLGLYLYFGGEAKMTVAFGTFAIYAVFNVLLIKFLMAEMKAA